MFKTLQGITWRGGDKKQAGQEDWRKFKLFYSWKKSLRARRDWRALKSLLEMLMESSCSDWILLMLLLLPAISLTPTQDEEVDILFQIKQQNEMTSLLWSSFSSWACVSYSYSCRTKSRARRRLRIFFTCSHARFSPGKWWWIINHRRWERVLLLLTSAEPAELVIKKKKRKNNSLGPLPLFFKFSRTPSIHIPHPASSVNVIPLPLHPLLKSRQVMYASVMNERPDRQFYRIICVLFIHPHSTPIHPPLHLLLLLDRIHGTELIHHVWLCENVIMMERHL